mmetsp:Transcript_17097/g.52978  ORF Transcript_17097/g.52978 Transcript_17097/m.52978 type:complete len:83 (-) Transcript_17097:102-350(-)
MDAPGGGTGTPKARKAGKRAPPPAPATLAAQHKERDTSDLDAMMLGADGDTDELMGMPPERLLHAGEFWSPPDDLDDSNDGQ